MPESSRSLLGSVHNAARVLRAFTHADQELGVAELSRRLGLSKSTTHRLVATLEHERLLEQDQRTGKYRLGLALYELGTTVTEHVDLHQAALPVLTTLRHATGEMVHVAVLDGVGRDQLMAKHKANHVQVAYAPDADAADRAATAKAAMFDALGLTVNLCGEATMVSA